MKASVCKKSKQKQKLCIFVKGKNVVKIRNSGKYSGGGIISNGRIGYIDAIKGFAIICVVIGHIADGYLKANAFPKSNYMLYCIYNIIYAFHMPLFMMISGFVYYNAYFDEENIPKRNRINRQILNLLVIYVFFSIVFGIFKIICGRFVNNGVDPIDLLLIWIKPIYPYWYMYILIIFYAIFSRKIVVSSNKYISLAIIFFLSLTGSIIYVEYFELSHIMYYSLFFAIGIFHRKNEGLKSKRLGILLFLISVFLTLLFWDKAYDAGTFICSLPVVNLIIAVGLISGLWFCFEHVCALANNSLLRLCGRYSLEIYVIHCVFTAGFRTLFPKIGITNVYLSVVFNFIISTAAPILFSSICKKLNIHEFLFKPVTYLADLKGALNRDIKC